MATRHERTADRRAWYAWKLARRLTTASIRSVAWPPPEVDWCRKVYVGHGSRPESSAEAMVVEFEPDQPLDADATWSARLMLPECCRAAHQSESMDIQLDDPDQDGTVHPRRGRGTRLQEVALRVGKAWADHAAHAESEAVEPAMAEPASLVARARSGRMPQERTDAPSVGRQARHTDSRHATAHVAAVAGG